MPNDDDFRETERLVAWMLALPFLVALGVSWRLFMGLIAFVVLLAVINVLSRRAAEPVTPPVRTCFTPTFVRKL